MPEAAPSFQILRFGVFELDLRTGELRKQGLKVRLQERPLQILALLLENPGQVVTREELRQKLWPADTFVDFDHSVNTAINKLREALGDSAENPRFVETLPRHGYRFIAAVDSVAAVYDRRPLENPLPEERRKGTAQGEIGMKIVPDQPPSHSASITVAPALPAGTAQKGSKNLAQAKDPKRRRVTIPAMGGLVAMLALLIVLNAPDLHNWLLTSVGARHTAPLPKIESIAVLPMENLSGDPSQEYFADGMTEELITDLGKISALRVISRTSVMRYKRTKKPLPEIASELNVDAIVEGTVRRSGNRVRITANLLYAPSDRHLWAQAYERHLGNVLSLQDEVARAIAGQIKIKLTPEEHARLSGSRPVNPQAYDDYLKGMQHWYNLTPQDIDTALRYFQLALKNDPDSARAYGGISLVWVGRAQMGYTPPREAAPKAKAAAIKAVELDPTLAEAHFALAGIKAWGDWDWAGAEPEFKKAIELNPNFADARAYYSHYLLTMRRPEEGMQQMQDALDLDPLNGLYRVMYGIDLYWVRRYDDAIAQARLALQMTPGNPGAYSVLSEAYLLKGMYKESFIWVKAAVAAQGYHDAVRALEQGYTEGGYPVAMRRAAEVLAASSRRSYVDPWAVASLYLYAGDKAKALDWLEKSLEIHEPNMPYLGVPVFDSLRPDPRFQSILRRMHFPP